MLARVGLGRHLLLFSLPMAGKDFATGREFQPLPVPVRVKDNAGRCGCLGIFKVETECRHDGNALGDTGYPKARNGTVPGQFSLSSFRPDLFPVFLEPLAITGQFGVIAPEAKKAVRAGRSSGGATSTKGPGACAGALPFRPVGDQSVTML